MRQKKKKPARPPGNARTLVIRGKSYKWKYRGTGVKIWVEDGTTKYIRLDALLNRSLEDISRDKEKGNLAITPSDIARYLTK
jgi:hypothetical protein